MILIVMVGMSLIFAYVTVYTGSYQSGIGSSVLESMTIEDIWIQPYNIPNLPIANITVYDTSTRTNLGTDAGLNITVSGIYVNGTALSNPLKYNSIDFRNNIVGPGKHMTIECQAPSGFFETGNTYAFKVVTTRGSDFEAQVHY